MKKLLTSALLLAGFTAPSFAQDVSWQLRIDYQYDGQLAAQYDEFTLVGMYQMNMFTLRFFDRPVHVSGSVEPRQISEIGSGTVPRIDFTIANGYHRIRYLGAETTSGVFEGVYFGSNGGTGDFRLDTNPVTPVATSCKALLDAQPGAVSDYYTIDPDGDGGVEPFDVYCDMVFDGGGWTRVGFFNDVSELGDYTASPVQGTNPTASGWHVAYSSVVGLEVRLGEHKGTLPLPNQSLKENISNSQTQVIVGTGLIQANTVYINTEMRTTCSGSVDTTHPIEVGDTSSDYVRLNVTEFNTALAGQPCYDHFSRGDSWGRKDRLSRPDSDQENHDHHGNWLEGVWVR